MFDAENKTTFIIIEITAIIIEIIVAGLRYLGHVLGLFSCC